MLIDPNAMVPESSWAGVTSRGLKNTDDFVASPLKNVSYLVLLCMLIFPIWVPSIRRDSTTFLLDYRSVYSAIILMN